LAIHTLEDEFEYEKILLKKQESALLHCKEFSARRPLRSMSGGVAVSFRTTSRDGSKSGAEVLLLMHPYQEYRHQYKLPSMLLMDSNFLREETLADPIHFWLLLNQAIPATTGAMAQLGQRIRQLGQKKSESRYPVLYCC
jgi:hypothetical protein